MPYLVRTYKVWDSLRKRFDLLIRGEIEEKEMLPTIQPITNADELLRTHDVYKAGITTSSTGVKNVFTCPDGKRVLIKGIGVEDNVGTNAITQIEYQDPDGNDITLWVGSATEPVNLPMDAMFHPFWMEPGGVIQFTVATAGTSMWIKLLREVEDYKE